MATIREVQDTLGLLIESVVYPNGVDNPSITGDKIFISSGWPIKNRLDTDLVGNNVHVSIFPIRGSEKNTTRFPKVWQEISRNTQTILPQVNSNTITINGTVTVPQTVMAIVNNTGYAYPLKETDTLEDVANGLAAIIPNATASENVVTINGAHSLIARVSVRGIVARESKRQEKLYYVTVWANTPELRETVGSAIDVSLGDIERANLPDGSAAAITYKGSQENDHLQKSIIYRRDLIYTIEYPTLISKEAFSIADIVINVDPEVFDNKFTDILGNLFIDDNGVFFTDSNTTPF